MDNSLKTKEKPPEEGELGPSAKGKTKIFLIGKKLKITDLRQTAAERGKRNDNKTQPQTPDSLRQGPGSSRWHGSYAALRPCG